MFLPPSSGDFLPGQLMCEEWKFLHQLGGFERCVLDREFGMLEWPEFKGWMMIYLDVALV
jgi:hypothetical protein